MLLRSSAAAAAWISGYESVCKRKWHESSSSSRSSFVATQATEPCATQTTSSPRVAVLGLEHCNSQSWRPEASAELSTLALHHLVKLAEAHCCFRCRNQLHATLFTTPASVTSAIASSQSRTRLQTCPLYSSATKNASDSRFFLSYKGRLRL